MASVTLRTKEIEKKGYSLFLDIYNEGQRYKEYLKLYVSKDYTKAENKNVLKVDKDSWDLAKAIQAKRITAINESNAGFIPKASKRDFITYYREQAAQKNHGSYEHALVYLLEFSKQDKLFFKAIDDIFLKEYIAFLKTKPLSASSVRMYLSRLSIILNLAVKDKIIQVNPFTYLKRGVGGDIPLGAKNKIEYLSIQELRLLNNTAYRDDVKQFFFFGCFTGLRISDMLKIKWTEIENKTLTYTQKKQRNAKTHYLPLSTQAVNLLPEIENSQIKKLGREHEFVFAHLPDKRMLNRHLKSWATAAKLKKNLHIHVSRHTFATLALSNGVSLYTVSKLLGHSNIAITQIYAEVVDEMKQKAADMIPTL